MKTLMQRSFASFERVHITRYETPMWTPFIALSHGSFQTSRTLMYRAAFMHFGSKSPRRRHFCYKNSGFFEIHQTSRTLMFQATLTSIGHPQPGPCPGQGFRVGSVSSINQTLRLRPPLCIGRPWPPVKPSTCFREHKAMRLWTQ